MADMPEESPSSNSDNKDSDKEEEVSPKPIRRRKHEEKRSQVQLGQSDQQKDIASKVRKKKKKEENALCSRFIAFLMKSPTVIYFFSVLYDLVSKYSFSGRIYHIGALVLGFFLAGLLCIFVYKPLKPYLKYVACASLFVFFIPTIQVFNCSPIYLNNSEIGTLVSLKEEAEGFLKIAYQNSDCWKRQYFKTPVQMSLYSPRLSIVLKPYQIINIGMQHFDQQDEEREDGPPPEALPYTLYLLTSKRSVKRQIYYINLLTMVAGRTRGIADVLDLSVDDRENITLRLTGSLRKLDAGFQETKKELELMEYLVRPVVFHVHDIHVHGMPEKENNNEGNDSNGGRRNKGKGKREQN